MSAGRLTAIETRATVVPVACPGCALAETVAGAGPLRNTSSCVTAGGESPSAGWEGVPVVRLWRLVPLLLVGNQLR